MSDLYERNSSNKSVSVWVDKCELYTVVIYPGQREMRLFPTFEMKVSV